MESLRKAYQSRDYTLVKELGMKIIQKEPRHEEAYFLVANALHMIGQLGQAIKFFNKVLEINPKNTDASISLSVILNDIGRYEQAQEIFQKADSFVKKESDGVKDPHINKQFSLKHYELAEMYFSYNRLEESIFEYNKAINLDPENLAYSLKLAKVYSKKGYVSKSLELLKKIKIEHPHYIPARLALGLIHFGRGNTIEAQTEWKNALTRDPDNKEVRMYLKLSENATETNLTI